ncbi:MAG: SRPBCC family protein [Alphaproteobacteria bacterium]|nr:MAG: SRPBCC family protein [Alphaproteobacteria bacterium]
MELEPYGQKVAPDTVELVRLLPGPIERLWAYLTDPEKRATWFAGGPMDLRVGGTVKLHFKHSNLMQPGEVAPEKYRAVCEEGAWMESRITECVPPTRLAYEWPEGNDSISEVLFSLREEGDKVRLTVTHRRLASRALMLDVSGGWHAHLGLLADVLAGRPRRPFWPSFAGLRDEYERRLLG